MKVPKMYKSSDLYDAGTDVIYDDDSKLQYAPFVYATTGSGGDSGDDSGGGDDEEGEDTMIVIYDGDTKSIDKSFKDLKDAVNAGKVVVMKEVSLDDDTGYLVQIAYLTSLDNQNEGTYIAYFSTVYSDGPDNELDVYHLEADNETDPMTQYQAG